MEAWALVASIIACALALGAVSVTVWQLFHQPTDTSVTELAHELKRARKAEAMRVVREEAAAAREASAPIGPDGKPLPFGPVNSGPGAVADRKAALRHQVFGNRFKGNGGHNEPV